MKRYIQIFAFLILSVLPSISYGQNTTVTGPKKPMSTKQTNSVKISVADGEHYGHGYVDLGLPSGTLWAACNVGADSPTDLGEQYAWGEIKTKSNYTEENSLWHGKECDDIGGHPEFDVATAKWGEHWRLPSHDQIKELDEKCKWIYTKKNGVRGFIVIGPNGKNIFLPSRMSKSEWTYGTYVCGYWSSTPNKRDSTSDYDYFRSASGTNSNNKRLVYSITSSDNSAWICSSPKHYGNSVRPVYSDAVYSPNPNFIRPEGRTSEGKAVVLTISGCWDIPAFVYGNIKSKDSGMITAQVKFGKDGVVTSISMKGFGPVSKNEETCKAVETEIRSKKMKPSVAQNKPIPDESEATIRYEFR